MTVANSHEVEYKRAMEIVRPFLWERLKAFPITLGEFDKLAGEICGIIAQHYREGAYHGDIDAKAELTKAEGR